MVLGYNVIIIVCAILPCISETLECCGEVGVLPDIFVYHGSNAPLFHPLRFLAFYGA